MGPFDSEHPESSDAGHPTEYGEASAPAGPSVADDAAAIPELPVVPDDSEAVDFVEVVDVVEVDVVEDDLVIDPLAIGEVVLDQGSAEEVVTEELVVAEIATEPAAALVVSPFSHHPGSPEPVSTPAPAAGAAFGLLFQAPDPASLPVREERRPDREHAADRDEGRGERAQRDERPAHRADEAEQGVDADALDHNAQDHDGQDRDGQGNGPQDDAPEDAENASPRRRRGGRGRRTRGAKDDSAAGQDSNQDDTKGAGPAVAPRDVEVADGDSRDQQGADASDDEGDDGGNSRRRTRRRRRGSATGVDEDGVKVRASRDEVTAIKGSTRLEAKKQRRREGREASRRRTVITEAEFLARRESVERTMVVREKDDLIQIGVIEDGVLVEHYVSRETQQGTMAGNVYLGRIQNVLPSMEAAFVDIGRGRNGVLYAGEVNWDAAGLDGQPKRIEHALKSGETVMVQVTKDPLGHKGARLTSQISLPGRFLVYVPGNSMTGISRKLPDTERARLKKILREIVPEDAGVIVRTAAEGASEEDLRADVERLKGEWERIETKAKGASAPAVLHGEPDLMIRVVRDVFNEDFGKLVVAGDTAWAQISDYLADVAPELGQRAEKWTGEVDLFSTYRIDEQLAKALDRKVWLPSGGSLVIDRTEAMTVVDVNTGKFVGSGGNLEETVTKNNIEAAEEIVRQLRLRDIGGIIVVDFIDMVLESNRDLVVRRLLECLGRDRTKHQVAEVTSLGLVQMTRKRVGTGLLEIFSDQCEHCAGRGIVIRDTPAEKPNTANGGGMSGGNPSRNQRKGRGTDAGRRAKAEPEPTKPNGPSAAQIAAAAHAAAAKKLGDQADQQSGAEEFVVTDPVVPVPADDRTEVVAPPVTIVEPSVADVPAPVREQPAPATRRKKRPRVVAPAGPPTGDAQITTVDLAGQPAHQ